MRCRSLLAVLSLAAGAACGQTPGTGVASPPNLLLVTIDTLRADRVGTGITPVIDGWAGRGLRFINARTVAPLTLPAHASMLSGQLPPAHLVRVNGDIAALGETAVATRLRRAGYRTGAVTGAFVLDRRFGLSEGFEIYDDQIPRSPTAPDRLEAERPANVVVDRAIDVVSRLGSSQPWFVWVHLYDPHAPYEAPAGGPAARSPYDAEVAFADQQLGRLLTTIGADQEAANIAFVIAGDHGEGLGEHGESTHGMLLYDATLKVPLIVAAPGVAAAVRTEPVSLVDVAPTLLALARQAPDAALAGRSLIETTSGDREIYAETDYPAAAGWQPARALVQDRFKVVSAGSLRLFDLMTDPAEAQNLASVRPQAVAAMAARLQTLASAPRDQSPAPRRLDDETVARLRALGYVTSSPVTTPKATAADAADHIAAWTTFERALSLRARGDNQEAASLLGPLAREYVDAPVFQSTYAQVLAESGNPAMALRILRDLVRRNPEDATLYYQLSVAARQAGQRVEALRAVRATLAIDASQARAHDALGLLLSDDGDAAGAVAAFAEAVRLDSSNPTYYANLGNARHALGDRDGARQAFEQALERDATLANAANGLGVLLVEQGRAADAIPWFERATASEASFVEAELNLAIALQQSGQDERARVQYLRVERLAPAGSREHQAARALGRQLERRR